MRSPRERYGEYQCVPVVNEVVVPLVGNDGVPDGAEASSTASTSAVSDCSATTLDPDEDSPGCPATFHPHGQGHPQTSASVVRRDVRWVFS